MLKPRHKELLFFLQMWQPCHLRFEFQASRVSELTLRATAHTFFAPPYYSIVPRCFRAGSLLNPAVNMFRNLCNAANVTKAWKKLNFLGVPNLEGMNTRFEPSSGKVTEFS
jgi:hypothetical protein